MRGAEWGSLRQARKTFLVGRALTDGGGTRRRRSRPGGMGSGCTKPGRGGVAPCVALDAAQPFDFESKKQKEKSDLEAPAEAAGPGNQRE